MKKSYAHSVLSSKINVLLPSSQNMHFREIDWNRLKHHHPLLGWYEALHSKATARICIQRCWEASCTVPCTDVSSVLASNPCPPDLPAWFCWHSHLYSWRWYKTLRSLVLRAQENKGTWNKLSYRKWLWFLPYDGCIIISI